MRFLTQYLNVTVPTITPQSLLRVNGLTFVSITPPLRSLFFFLISRACPLLFVCSQQLSPFARRSRWRARLFHSTLSALPRVKELFRDSSSSDQGWGTSNEQVFDIPAIYVHDDVAQIYHHSKRAPEEFSALPPNAKYCVGLARYVQSPLNQFAALGPDMTAISLDKDNQHLV
jgi:hypothetical protein